MPGADGEQQGEQQARALPADAPPEPVRAPEAEQRERDLRQADHPAVHAEEGEQRQEQIGLERVHAAAPGGQIDRPGVQRAVDPAMQQGPGLIGGESLVLVEPAGHGAEAPQPREGPQNEDGRKDELVAFPARHGIPHGVPGRSGRPGALLIAAPGTRRSSPRGRRC